MTTLEQIALIARIIKDVEKLRELNKDSLGSWFYETAINNLVSIKEVLQRDYLLK